MTIIKFSFGSAHVEVLQPERTTMPWDHIVQRDENNPTMLWVRHHVCSMLPSEDRPGFYAIDFSNTGFDLIGMDYVRNFQDLAAA